MHQYTTKILLWQNCVFLPCKFLTFLLIKKKKSFVCSLSRSLCYTVLTHEVLHISGSLGPQHVNLIPLLHYPVFIRTAWLTSYYWYINYSESSGFRALIIYYPESCITSKPWQKAFPFLTTFSLRGNVPCSPFVCSCNSLSLKCICMPYFLC